MRPLAASGAHLEPLDPISQPERARPPGGLHLLEVGLGRGDQSFLTPGVLVCSGTGAILDSSAMHQVSRTSAQCSRGAWPSASRNRAASARAVELRHYERG